jgi:ATP synthase protein I
MTEGDRPSSLQKLDAELRKARERERGGDGPDERADSGGRPTSGLGLAFRIGSELVAGLAVGLGIGWALDRWLGTGPWLMVVFFFLGSAAGILNVWRTMEKMARETDGDQSR